MSLFKIVVFSTSAASFESKSRQLVKAGVEATSLIWGDSRRFSRAEVINQNRRQWLFFMDHDCELAPETLEVLRAQINAISRPVNHVVSGTYQNPHGCTSLQSAHNFIANTWLEYSFQSENQAKLLLGGVFLIYCSEKIDNSEYPLFWGGEDKTLSYQLSGMGFHQSYNSELRVIHHTSSEIWHFLKRAYLHGKHEVKFVRDNKNRLNYLYWIRKIDFADLGLTFLVLLHFCIQKSALLFQTIRPGNK